MRPASSGPDAPSLGVVVAGGVGVLAILVFVAALAFGASKESSPGDRVRVVQADGPAGVAVLAGRCLEQRVSAVEVRGEDGTALWRVASKKGSIERRFVVGAAAPFQFEEVVGLRHRPEGRVEAVVTFLEGTEVTTDAVTVDASSLPAESSELDRLPPPCGDDRDLGLASFLFAAAAVIVVGGYGVMLARFVRGR